MIPFLGDDTGVASYLLLEGVMCLLVVFNDISSVSSIASYSEGFLILITLLLGVLKFSLDEWTDLIILGFITIVVQGLLSFHHLKKFGHLLLQHLQQQQ
jgi:hypothetical protein